MPVHLKGPTWEQYAAGTPARERYFRAVAGMWAVSTLLVYPNPAGCRAERYGPGGYVAISKGCRSLTDRYCLGISQHQAASMTNCHEWADRERLKTAVSC